MDLISESRLVYFVVTGCVIMSQIYFLTKYHSANEVYLAKSPQKPVKVKDKDQDRVKGGDEFQARGKKKGAHHQRVDETLIRNESNLPDLDRSLKLFYSISVLINICLTLKYFVLCLLDSKSMREYRYLDCLLMGRVTMNGRTTGLSKYVGLCLPIFQLAWRFTMLYLRPNFNFIYMEFLLQNPNELIVREAKTQKRATLSNGLTSVGKIIRESESISNIKETGANKTNSGQLSDDAQLYSDQQGDGKLNYEHSTVLDYRNPFAAESSLDPGTNHIFSRLRPNRTFRAWVLVSQFLLFYLLIMLGNGVLWLLPALRMFLPLLLTRPGFRLNYYNCIEWISRQPNKQEYAFIDTISQNETKTALSMAAALMPFEDYIELNLYHSIRLALDICENVVLFTEACASFVIYTSVTILCAFDVYLYTEDINKRVEQMIQMLTSNKRLSDETGRNQRNGKNLPRLAFLANGCGRTEKSKPISTSINYNNQLDIDNNYHAQIIDIQAMIVDMFALIGAYNPYAAFYTIYTISIWCVYTTVCSIPWLFVPLMAESSKLEWYLFEAITTAFFFIIIGSLNAVRKSTSRLYGSLSSLAILDYTKVSCKNDRWLGLLKHYTPIPLYCFTIFRTSQISWLLGLKMFSWLGSALVVISSFFMRSVYRKE